MPQAKVTQVDLSFHDQSLRGRTKATYKSLRKLPKLTGKYFILKAVWKTIIFLAFTTFLLELKITCQDQGFQKTFKHK